MTFVAFDGMRRSCRVTPQVTCFRPGMGPAGRWNDSPTSPEEEERIGRDLSSRAVPNFISVVGGSTTGTAASDASAAGNDNTTMVSTLASPAAKSKRSNEGNISNSNVSGYEGQEDDGSDNAHAEDAEWDDGEKVNLEDESYNYTKVHNWFVWGHS